MKQSVDHVGFVGIGNIGYPMAETVLKAGFPVTVYDVRKSALEEFREAGGNSAKSPLEVAKQSDSVHIVVANAEQVKNVTMGPEGIFKGFENSDGGIVVIHSTVNPNLPKELDDLAPASVSVIDAPISGGEFRAATGDLSVMVGGEEDMVESIHSVLQPLAREIFYMGEIGSGEVTKLVNGIATSVNLMGVAEGLRLGEAYGISEEELVEVFKNSSANNFWMQNWEYFTEELGESHPRGYEGMREILDKDLHLALDMASDKRVKSYGLSVASQFVPDFFTILKDR